MGLNALGKNMGLYDWGSDQAYCLNELLSLATLLETPTVQVHRTVSNKVASEWKHKVSVSDKVAREWKYKVGCFQTS